MREIFLYLTLCLHVLIVLQFIKSVLYGASVGLIVMPFTFMRQLEPAIVDCRIRKFLDKIKEHKNGIWFLCKNNLDSFELLPRLFFRRQKR